MNITSDIGLNTWCYTYERDSTVILPYSFWIKGTLSLEINQDYFDNNIVDDGSYTLNASGGVYTKSITADNLVFSSDANGK